MHLVSACALFTYSVVDSISTARYTFSNLYSKLSIASRVNEVSYVFNKTNLLDTGVTSVKLVNDVSLTEVERVKTNGMTTAILNNIIKAGPPKNELRQA